ncbi:hypothetical protein [Cupriavidus basilensis]|uniref:hypothetical protein n=1 Tax=Cupriavidus basilensis TaxID=68895 RepID=UPI00031F54A4|nr:hypothetical protein [Cupriavidus basilensis]
MKRSAIAAAVLAAVGTPVWGAPATVSPAVVQQLERKLDDMAGQLEALKAELKAVKDQNATMATQQQTQARQQADQTAQVAQLQASQETLQQVAAKPSALDNLSVFGYGEINYSRPSRNTNDTRADIGRAVFGFGYRFDEKTRFASEFEVEHAIASSSDRGEFEVEQFYVDHMFTNKVGMTAGVFLMPVGLINEHHEPTAYYGVYRNFIETLIIPSTWREGGFALHGNTDFGLDWNVGLTTGLDLSKWNFTPETPLYSSALDLQINGVAPMQATHQEMSLANAKNASQYISLNYRGVSSLLLGGSVFTGNANPAAGAGSQRSTLWETHARWNPGKWDLSALYAQGSISNTAQVNAQFPGTANPMPASFYGWYLQAAYNVWQHGNYRAVPFVRFERYNMGAKYEGIAPGFSATPTQPVTATGAVFPKPYDIVWTAGLNFYLNPNVVFKIDYQRFRINRDFTRIDLGLGVYF